MAKWGMVIDLDKCTGCRICEEVCIKEAVVEPLLVLVGVLCEDDETASLDNAIRDEPLTVAVHGATVTAFGFGVHSRVPSSPRTGDQLRGR